MAENIPPGIRTGNHADLGDGIRLHYACAGEQGAPLMLFLHGFPEFWYAWKDLLPHYGKHRFAVAPDLRGYNLSSRPAETEAYKIGLTSTRLLLAAGDVVIGWLLLRAAIVAQARLEAGDAGKDTDFYTGKVAAAQFFARTVLPRMASEKAITIAEDGSLMDVPESAF